MVVNKRGLTVSSVILGGLGLFVLIVLAVALYGATTGGESFPSALSSSLDTTSNAFMNVLGPLFKALLGISESTSDNVAFLMVLTFILVAIVIVGTLDSVNMFGEEGTKGQTINFFVGIIVSIIGIRFMPTDMWASLTAPSSAFVATILVGIPFGAMFFVSMRLKGSLARKTVWIFYIVFMSWLIFFPSDTTVSNDFAWIYGIFLVLAIVMMSFDASVRKFIHKERGKAELETKYSKIDVLKRQDIRNRIEKWTAILNNPDSTDRDKNTARGQLTKLEKIFSEASGSSS